MDRRRPAAERIAHRGAPREFRENTVPAFERALERAADAIELDVHGTADGVIVVHHDPVLSVTVDHVLAGRPIDTVPWSELQSVELVPGITIPSLAQVLDLVGTRATVYVEIKGPGIEALVIDVIRGSGCRCAIHSFDHALIARARRIAPELRRGILFEEPPPDLGALMDKTGAHDVWPHWPLADAALVDVVHARDGRVIAWTVNSHAAAVELTAVGVDGLCTDDVRLLGEPR